MTKYTIKCISSEGIYYLVNGWKKCNTFWFNEKSVLEDKKNAKGSFLINLVKHKQA
ncbi:hypothetical protein [Clostridium sp.]|uniref:hypothetical protein n=1 Tax=Clostridium sp. TaxID=1506 RepID=UPI001A453E60|nr:hypothetical protein [Clostridium sp.]MBK5239776.1 hypothetical protein [Clostridium sp.]